MSTYHVRNALRLKIYISHNVNSFISILSVPIEIIQDLKDESVRENYGVCVCV